MGLKKRETAIFPLNPLAKHLLVLRFKVCNASLFGSVFVKTAFEVSKDLQALLDAHC